MSGAGTSALGPSATGGLRAARCQARRVLGLLGAHVLVRNVALVVWKGMYFIAAGLLGSAFGSVSVLCPFLPVVFISLAWYHRQRCGRMARTPSGKLWSEPCSGQLFIIPLFILLINASDFKTKQKGLLFCYTDFNFLTLS